jgi:hypothetical protein
LQESHALAPNSMLSGNYRLARHVPDLDLDQARMRISPSAG